MMGHSVYVTGNVIRPRVSVAGGRSDRQQWLLDGVNAYLSTQSPADLSFEYTVLEFTNHGYTPEMWSPVDTLSWGLAMAWELRGNMDSEIERAVLLGTLSDAQVAQLFPPYPGDINPYIVSPTENESTAVAASLQRVPGVRQALAGECAELLSD